MWPSATCRRSPPSCPKIGFEQVARVHLCYEVFHSADFDEFDPMVLAFNLAPVQLAGEGCNVGVGRVAPGIEEVRLDGELFLSRDDVPRLELLNHHPNVFLVTRVVFL